MMSKDKIISEHVLKSNGEGGGGGVFCSLSGLLTVITKQKLALLSFNWDVFSHTMCLDQSITCE